MKKLLWMVPAGLIALLVALFFSRNFIARVSVEVGARKATGFPLKIGSVDVGLFSSKVDVRNLTLMNPPDYQEKMFVDMPELFVDYQLGSFFSGVPHINDMLINIKQLVVVKTASGESNAMCRRPAGPGAEPCGTPEPSCRPHTRTVTSPGQTPRHRHQHRRPQEEPRQCHQRRRRSPQKRDRCHQGPLRQPQKSHPSARQ